MNTDDIFDAVSKASHVIHLMDDIRKKTEQIKSVTAEKCGNCEHWTKYHDCWAERKKVMKSMNDRGCGDFLLEDNRRLEIKFRQELVDLEKELASYKK